MEVHMKKSEAFFKAAVAVLDAKLSISQKQEIIGVLLWEKYFAEMSEEKDQKNESV
jgi:hypothetical protein